MVSKAGFGLVAVALFAAALAGCVDGDDGGATGDGDGSVPGTAGNWTMPTVMSGAAFTPTHIVDDMRAGGEPVIAITDDGTIIVSAHPGYTHYHPHPVSPELLVPSQTQSYLWRSTDGGESWEHVSLLPVDSPNSAPRGVGQGVSDPDLTIDANGRIWLTDLEALAASSVSWSDDDGETWLMGNNIASGGPIDRQWLASFEDTVFFTGNYFPTTVWPGSEAGFNDFIASQNGIVWETRGSTPCNGDPVVNPSTGVIYQACGNGFTYSSDGGVTWERSEGPVGCGLCEVGIDAAGTVFQAGPEDGNISVAFTTDDGATWSEPLELTQFFPELEGQRASIWPWTSAGSEGRVAVTWLSAAGAENSRDLDAEWHAYSVLIVNATGNGTTQVWPATLTDEVLHRGAICVGTVCQVKTPDNDANDRRMGDFFETTISPDGNLHVVYSNTAAYPDHGVSHVAFHKQVAGPALVEGELAPGFPTQG